LLLCFMTKEQSTSIKNIWSNSISLAAISHSQSNQEDRRLLDLKMCSTVLLCTYNKLTSSSGGGGEPTGAARPPLVLIFCTNYNIYIIWWYQVHIKIVINCIRIKFLIWVAFLVSLDNLRSLPCTFWHAVLCTFSCQLLPQMWYIFTKKMRLSHLRHN
jgi:hypothetical protein